MRLTGMLIGLCALAAAVLAAGLTLSARSGDVAGAATIRLLPDQKYQTITGWEATPDIPDTPASPDWAPYHDQQLLMAARDGGINRVRIDIRSDLENSDGNLSRFIGGQLPYAIWKDLRYRTRNDNDDPFKVNWAGFNFDELDWYMDHSVMPLRKLVAARGERLYINACYVAFKGGRTFQRNPEEYAEFVLVVYSHLQQKYGLVPDSWEMILEPDLPKDGWTGTEIGQAMVATARRLKAAGFTPAFVAPSVTDMRNALPYLDAIAAVPGATDYLKEFSYHRYKGASGELLAQIAARAKALGLRTSMLEWWFGKATYDVLFQDLKIGNVSAWQGRMLEGMYVPQPDGSIGPRPDVRYNALLFRAVRAGAVRIGTDSDSPKTFDAVAFVNPDGGYAVILRARQPGTVTVTGLPPGRYRISYALPGGTQTLADPVSPDASGNLAAVFPEKGLLTITRAGG